MAVARYRIALNNARFPLVSTWGERAVVTPSNDSAGKTPRQYQGSDENIDFNVAQVLYGENFVPVSNGLKSVSYVRQIAPTVATDFDQIFPLRDADENTVLYSPAGGNNYVYDSGVGAWATDTTAALLAAEGYVVASLSTHTPGSAAVTRAYVDGKTFVCYSRLGCRVSASPTGAPTHDGSLFFWDPATKELVSLLDAVAGALVTNLPIPVGEIDGVSSSNGYLLMWSGLTVYWAPFNGTAFDYSLYANGEVTGAGNQIPEDIKGPITALVPVSGGFIIFTTKNAVAAFYNANNFASPWIFKPIANAGGVSSFEQTTDDSNLGSIYAYTTGGLQKITLNSAESSFPDVTDFLGLRYLERFNTGSLTFERGAVTTEFFVKTTFCGQRFLVVSYGTFPGIYSFALVYDAELRRWGKLRIVHRDCFPYSYGTLDAPLTYAMLGDVSYEEMGTTTYEGAIIEGGALTYPRQAVAFLLNTGEVKLAVMDMREQDPDDTSEAFVLLGRHQLSRARLSTVHEAEVEGLVSGGSVSVIRSIDGMNFYSSETGYLREQTQQYAEYGFDMVTGKNFTLYVKGQFYLSTIVLHATNDGAI